MLFSISGWIGTAMYRRGSAIDESVSVEGSKEAFEEGKLRVGGIEKDLCGS
jgi:hypothetical protein